MRNGERQVSPTLEGVRRDHLERYRWAAERLAPNSRVIDAACGIGYGAYILAEAGHHVLAIDNDAEALAYGRRHYDHAHIEWRQANIAEHFTLGSRWDAVVCFETIEHIKEPLPFLRELRRVCDHLLASVPNEAVFPYQNYRYHHRHYLRTEFLVLLRAAGWGPTEWFGQEGRESEVEIGLEGRTLIVTAAHEVKGNVIELVEDEATFTPAPDHVAIVGLGPSCTDFFNFTRCLGGTRAYCDEVWGVNAIGGVLACDRIFHMDDLAVQELRAEAKPQSNIAEMVKWLRRHPGPVYTSVVREGYPGLVAYPLEEVLNAGFDSGGVPYFNSTVPYAIAYAIHIGVKRISLFGVDYTQPNAHHGERGRACCEYWLGIAAARGIEISVPDSSTLLDACAPERERLYGYDMVDVHVIEDNGKVSVQFTEREDKPTAEDVEAAYDHKKHPNRLVAAEAAE
jgi:SAM-dependent methyltransferase